MQRLWCNFMILYTQKWSKRIVYKKISSTAINAKCLTLMKKGKLVKLEFEKYHDGIPLDRNFS